jgi:hypothetical protein
MGTINEAEAERQRREVIALLEQDRAKKAAALAEVDAKLAVAKDGDFRARLGDRKRSQMSTKEKTEVIRKLGHREYLNLDW